MAQIIKKSIYAFTKAMLASQLTLIGLKKYLSTQIFQWIYQKNITSFDEMTNISKNNIKILKKYFYFNDFEIVKILQDPVDETIKFLFKLQDGEFIETVIMKFNYGYSVCISTQVGCNMGCRFCASGLLKKKRNLSVDEIVLQFLKANQYLFKNKQSRITNLVVMGIGEPFDNYSNLVSALKIINDQQGLSLGSRHITVSTCGLCNKIIDFALDLPQVNLAISLHGATDDVRNKIMPINQAYNLKVLFETITKYLAITNRRISFEYLLLKGINDSENDLKNLINLTKGLLCYVNLIIYNSVNEHEFQPSDRAKHFMEELNKNKIVCTIRLERGSRINAACGQLRANYEKKN